MCENYTYEDQDFLPGNALEDYFAKIETAIAPEIKKIIDCLEKSTDETFAKAKILLFSILPELLVFYYRSGALLNEFAQGHKANKIFYLTEKILNDVYIKRLAKTLINVYSFAFIEGDFILSDQFISTAGLKIKSNFSNVSNRHIGLRETLVLIPLSSKYYALFWHSDSSFLVEENCCNNLSEIDNQKINEVIINNSYEKSVSKDQNLLATLLEKHKRVFPTQVFWGGEKKAGGFLKKKEIFFHDIDAKAFDYFFHVRLDTIMDYTDLGRNDLCACGSKKKFKKCHMPLYERVEEAWRYISDPKMRGRNIHSIPGTSAVEFPIAEWVNNIKD